MNDSPPPTASVCFYSLGDPNQQDDNCSELTEPCSCHGEEDLLQKYGLDTDDDPYLQRTLLNSKGESPTKLTEEQQQQQRQLTELKLKPNACELENDSLKAEKAIFIDELALSKMELPITITRRRRRCVDYDNEASMSVQQLVSANAKLTTDNARLQVVVDVMRKSFEKQMDESRLVSERLEQENKLQRQQLLELSSRYTLISKDGTAPTALMDESKSACETSPIDSSRRPNQENDIILVPMSNSSSPIQDTKKFGSSGDDWTTSSDGDTEDDEGDEVEVEFPNRMVRGKYPRTSKTMPMASNDRTTCRAERNDSMIPCVGKKARTTPNSFSFSASSKNCSFSFTTRVSTTIKPMDLLVDFAESRRRRPSSRDNMLRRQSSTSRRGMPRRQSSSLNLGSSSVLGDLLVDFGERESENENNALGECEPTTRRPRSTARRWNSVKLMHL